MHSTVKVTIEVDLRAAGAPLRLDGVPVRQAAVEAAGAGGTPSWDQEWQPGALGDQVWGFEAAGRGRRVG